MVPLVGELTLRRDRALASAGESVLDLSSPDAAAEVLRAATGTAPAHRRYDLVVSTGALPGFADLHLALTGVERLLTPGGTFRFVEPDHHPGVLATAIASVLCRGRSVRHLHLERDVPGTARAAGLTVVDLERFTMPMLPWPLRRFVDGVAHRRADVWGSQP